MRFKDLFTKKVPKPAWAGMFSGSDWNAYVLDFQRVAQSLGLEVQFQWDQGSFSIQGEETLFGMENVSRTWINAERANRPGVIERHLTTMRNAREAEVEDPHAALRIRIYPTDSLVPEVKEHMVLKELSPGAVQVLVADFPTVISTVTTDQIKEWGMNPDAAWEIGVDNLSKHEQCEVYRIELNKLVPMTAVEREMYGASMILDLDRFLVPMPENGAYVVIPTRDVLYWCAVPDHEHNDWLKEIRRFAQYVYQTQAGAVTPEVFIWKEGQLELMEADQSMN